MIINFTKMHSLGNDFIIIDGITQNIHLNGAYIKKIADRKTGIGCDQVIILEPPIDPASHFYYKIYNADGQQASQCLNGIRCAAKLAIDLGLVKNTLILAECLSGKVKIELQDQLVTVNVGSIVPLLNNYPIKYQEIELPTYKISVGNNHLICFINSCVTENSQPINLPDLSDPIYEDINKTINEQYDQRINIGFAKIESKDSIKLRVFERGCGETLACGSNALATAITAYNLNLVNNKIKIGFTLGNLEISLVDNNWLLAGSVHTIFNGRFKI